MTEPIKVEAKASHPDLLTGQGSGYLQVHASGLDYWPRSPEEEEDSTDESRAANDGESAHGESTDGESTDGESTNSETVEAPRSDDDQTREEAVPAEPPLVSIPLEGMELKLGGASDRLVMISHPDLPGWQLHSTEHKLLSHPAWASHPDVVLIQRKLDLKHKVRGVLMLSAALLLILCCVGLWKGVDPASRWLAQQIPPEREAQLGEAVFEQILADSHVIDDPKINQELDRLAEPLILAIDSDRYEFQFVIIEDETINAFALPGGYMALHTGLILKADRPEEVLGVMAHELAHVTEQHSMRVLIKQLGLKILLDTILGGVSAVSDVLQTNAPALLHLKFSRDHETEADTVGFEYLERANIDPSGMIDFFEKIKKEHEEGGASMDGALSILSTHPATDDRIENLERLISEESHGGPYKNLDLNFDQFQDMLRRELDAPE